MYTKKALFEALADAPDDCVVLVIENKPGIDFDNQGEPIQQASWERPIGNPDPGDMGVCYISIDGLEKKEG